MNKKYIMPPLVLTIISVIICGLLVLAYNITYVDTSGILTDKIREKATEIYPDGEFSLITLEDEEGKTINLTYDNVENVIYEKTSGDYLFEVITNGYNANGIDILVGISEDGKVTGINYVSITDSPTQSKKVKDNKFISSFIGASDDTSVDSLDGVSQATYSSNGIKDAVKTAINTYNENKDEIIEYKNNIKEEVTDE